jgi:hypothetical protein
MGQLFRAISDLAGKVISLSLVGGAILLVAGEIRLAALKKSLSRLIQAFTLHRAYDGHESKRHLKITINF